MGIKWKQTTLGDLALGVDGAVDGPFGSNLPAAAYTDSGYPIIRGSNLSIGLDDFKDSDFVFVPEHIFQKLSRSECRAGDIIFTKKGTLGQTGLISTKHRFEKYLLSSNQMRLRVDPDQALSEYVYYYVSSQKAISKLIQDSEHTGVPKINLTYLKSFPILLPSLNEQKDIIDILGSLNKKITLNRKINQTLEQMSQALFKSWFVDFDPVIDNALDAGNDIPESLQSRVELRQKIRERADFKPLSTDILALFPAEFEESPLGWMPKGWQLTDVGGMSAKIFSGGTPNTRTDEYWNGSLNWFSSGETRNTLIVDTENKITDIGVQKSSTKLSVAGDILIASAGQGHTRGQTSLNTINTYINQSVVCIRPKKQIYSGWLFFNLFYRYEEMRAISDSHSIRGSLTTKTISSMKVIQPCDNLLSLFDHSCSVFTQKIKNNMISNISLTNLRDTLLPKLISGELSLENVENLIKQTEAA